MQISFISFYTAQNAEEAKKSVDFSVDYVEEVDGGFKVYESYQDYLTALKQI